MIFFLLFAKELNHPGGALGRRLVRLCTAAVIIAGVFLIIQLSMPDPSRAIVPGETAFYLGLLLGVLLIFCGEAMRMMRRDLYAAAAAFRDWGREREKGRLYFILKQFAITLPAVLVWLLVFGRRGLRVGLSISNIIIACLVVTGIALAFAAVVWRLNLKYQDDVAALLKPPRQDEQSLFQ